MLLVKNTVSAPPKINNQHYTDYGKQRKKTSIYILTLKSAWPNLRSYIEMALHCSSYPLLSSEQLRASLSCL